MSTVNETAKYNVTEIEVNSFSDLFFEANMFMGGGLGYGVVFVVWLISFTTFSQYPNTDSLVASTYSAWLTSILFAVFEVVPSSFPLVLFIVVAAVSAYRYLTSP